MSNAVTKMTIIHADDPTTRFLSVMYESRQDAFCRVTEQSTNSDVIRSLKESNTIMMLGHGNKYGLFSTPDRNGNYSRFLITDRHVEFLRGKTCIGIWCYADQFARRYGLHGLFSGMIVSELQEAIDLNLATTHEEVTRDRDKFARRLHDCIEWYPLDETPKRIKDLDDVHSELTLFNYNNLYYL